MEWDELELEAAEQDQDEEAPAEQETFEPDADEPDQESGDSLDDAAEETDEETDTEDSDSEEEESDAEAESEEEKAEDAPQPSEIVTISGNAIIFPEEYDFTAFSSSTEDTDAVVQAVDEQTNVLRSGFFAVVLLLGIIVGLLFVHGFRLRRV